jgi:hypothetical protein
MVCPSKESFIEVKALSRLAINATMVPDGATTLCESINPHPTLRPHCTMPPRLDISDEEDANHSASRTLQPVSTP